MYRCEECGHLFEEGEQKSWTEPHGERLSGCPICFGNYSEVGRCSVCGCYNCEENQSYCNDCKVETLKKFKSLIDEFTEEEKEILREEDAGELI